MSTHRATDGRTVEFSHVPATEHRPERFALQVRNGQGEALSSLRFVFERETFLGLAAEALSTYTGTIPVGGDSYDDGMEAIAEAVGVVELDAPKRHLRAVEGCE